MAVYLIPNKIIDIGFGLKVKQKIIPDDLRATKTIASYIKKGDHMKPCKPIGDNGKPKGITMHNTPDIKVNAATTPAEQYCRATYNGNMGGAVVHYYVWHTDIWQLLRDNEQGWHAGDKATRKANKLGNGVVGGNLDTIAIECIGDDPQSTDTTSKLAVYLLHKYGLTINELYTHQYFSGKYCPQYILPFWIGFEADVKNMLAEITPKPNPAPVPVPAPAPMPTPKPTSPFPDVAPDAWYAEMIAELKAAGIVNGYPDGTVRPEGEALRAELFAVAYKLLKMIQDK